MNPLIPSGDQKQPSPFKFLAVMNSKYREIGRWSLVDTIDIRACQSLNSPDTTHIFCLGQVGRIRWRSLELEGLIELTLPYTGLAAASTLHRAFSLAWIPALEMDTRPCSITSWIAVRSMSVIWKINMLSNHVTQFLRSVNWKSSKRKHLLPSFIEFETTINFNRSWCVMRLCYDSSSYVNLWHLHDEVIWLRLPECILLQSLLCRFCHEQLFTKEKSNEYNSSPLSILVVLIKWHHANFLLMKES